MVGRRDLIKRVGAGAAAAAMGGVAIAPTIANGAGAAVLPPRKVAMILLDRSGSMAVARQATIDGLNRFIDEQRGQSDLMLGLIQFDSPSDHLEITPTITFTAAPHCPRLVDTDFQPRGGTPLLAAVAEAINRMEKLVRAEDKALLIVQTDGEENTSPPEITKDVIRALIASKEAEGNWTFVFMGADIDAWGAGGSMGIALGNTLQYVNNYSGTVSAYASASVGTRSWAASTATNSKDFYGVVPATGDQP